jgi:hypothetical protein
MGEGVVRKRMSLYMVDGTMRTMDYLRNEKGGIRRKLQAESTN